MRGSALSREAFGTRFAGRQRDQRRNDLAGAGMEGRRFLPDWWQRERRGDLAGWLVGRRFPPDGWVVRRRGDLAGRLVGRRCSQGPEMTRLTDGS